MIRCALPFPSSPRCHLGRHGHHRLLTSLSSASGGDPSAADRVIRKFVASSSRTASLEALSLLLSRRLSSFALPMYRRISETAWFRWNPKLAADVVANLEAGGRSTEADALISNSILDLAPKEIALFHRHLIRAYSEHGLSHRAIEVFSRLKEISGGAVDAASYEAMICGLCELGLPQEAELLREEMFSAGFKISGFAFRSVVMAYGRSGSFGDMRRVVGIMEGSGHALDTVGANVVLSCYGDHGELPEMVSLLRKMRDSGIKFSIRTYNSVLKSCPTIGSMLQDPGTALQSIRELIKELEKAALLGEVELVQELVQSSVLDEILRWSPSEVKLDLHGLHLGSVYVILLQWLDMLRDRLCSTEGSCVPLEVTVVCGSGKHSSVRGQSPVKGLVSEMMFKLSSPLRIDRNNVGRFIAKGKAVKEWLC
ncbi:Pentatricopeptide repeat-containing protein [Acorus calamus]|uniref:Pentatricopeptide repeat-containing protein n=1 Tax=Acorus calamus TaxID=4465 RepID=A0AAV9D585_ACOCL|nr:Pentatricopeptide repeat-containing protein [Acorus calamus]